MSLAGLGVVAIWHDLAPEAQRRLLRVAQPRAHAGARRHSRAFAAAAATSRSAARRSSSTCTKPTVPETLGGPGLPQPPERADRVDAARDAVVPQRRALDLPRRVHQRRGQRRRHADDALRDRRRARATARSRRCAGASCRRSSYRKGIAGVHLCLADEARSATSRRPSARCAPTPRTCRRGSC